MGNAKDIRLEPIASKDAIPFIKAHHYSGKAVNNSQLHIGVFMGKMLEGVMSFGPSLDKRKIVGLVRDTGWNEFLELNRMAFTDKLPRNSESRALAIAFRLIRKYLPHIKWIISYADATQCGDGTIYRAAGFVLTGIKKNDQIWIAPDNISVATSLVATDTRRPGRQKLFAGSMTMLGAKGASRQRANILSRVTTTKGEYIKDNGAASMKPFKELGWKPLEGFQLRYIYFLDTAYKERLTVPVVPFSKIEEMGASMYRGEKRADKATQGAPDVQSGKGGAEPTYPLEVTKNG